MRRWIFWLLVAAFLWAISTHSEELTSLVETLMEGHWDWVVASAACQSIYVIVFAASFQAAFHAVEIKGRTRDLIPVVLGSMFVNAVAPAGGAMGMALFVDDATRRGNSAARATAGIIVQLIADFSALTLILIFSMTYLYFWEELPVQMIWGSAALTLITLGLGGVLGLGLWRPALLERIFRGLQRATTKVVGLFRRADFLGDDWAEKSAREFIGAATVIDKHPMRLLRVLGIMLAAHILAIASLYMLFQAFDQSIALGTLVAGYAVGILTWIVSPAPQGAGVIEGAMTLVFVSLGVLWNVAITVTLAFRGITFWLPVVLGFFLLRRVKTFATEERLRREGRGVQYAALLIGAAGVLNILGVVTPSMRYGVDVAAQFSPFFINPQVPIAALVSGFVLLMLALGIWRRKRVPWAAAVLLIAGVFIGLIQEGVSLENILLSGALLLWLLVFWKQFRVRSDWPAMEKGVRVLVGVFAFLMVYGMAGLFLLAKYLYFTPLNFATALRQTAGMVTQFSDPGWFPLGGLGVYFGYSVYIMGAAAVGYLMHTIVRPMRSPPVAVKEERERARKIVEAHGRSSVAFLTLFDERRYYFSPGGSVIAYTIEGRVALTLGDPIGPRQDIPGAITGFNEMCLQNDWCPAFCLTLPDYLEDYRKAGFKSICMGHEAIVDLRNFTLKGNGSKSFRKRYNRLTKMGYRVIFHESPISAELLKKLRIVSDEWLSMTLGTEKRFFLGRFEEEYLCAAPIAAVHAPDGSILAFTNVTSEFQIREITIDLMRRRKSTISGTMDFLFVSLFLWAQEQGYDTFNLGLCALAGAAEQPSGSLMQRSMQFLYEHGNYFYHFKGLREFKDKFHPFWSPQLLLFPAFGSLPAVWMGMVRANAGEGDMPWKFFRPRPDKFVEIDLDEAAELLLEDGKEVRYA